jgi:hypothetical protein
MHEFGYFQHKEKFLGRFVGVGNILSILRTNFGRILITVSAFIKSVNKNKETEIVIKIVTLNKS